MANTVAYNFLLTLLDTRGNDMDEAIKMVYTLSHRLYPSLKTMAKIKILSVQDCVDEISYQTDPSYAQDHKDINYIAGTTVIHILSNYIVTSSSPGEVVGVLTELVKAIDAVVESIHAAITLMKLADNEGVNRKLCRIKHEMENMEVKRVRPACMLARVPASGVETSQS